MLVLGEYRVYDGVQGKLFHTHRPWAFYTQIPLAFSIAVFGFDHGVGHPLLPLYDAKVPNCQKRKEFKGLGHYPSNIFLSSFCTMIKLQHLYNYLTFLPFLARY